MLVPINEVTFNHLKDIKLDGLCYSVQYSNNNSDNWLECPPVPNDKTDLDSAVDFTLYLQKNGRHTQYRIMVEV